MLQHPTCQATGCHHPASHCEAHHHTTWLNGGPTNLTNALLLCNRCHHRAHDPAYTYTVTTTGTVDFTRTPPSPPPGPPPG